MAMLQYAAGLAASPVVFYKLLVGGAAPPIFIFDARLPWSRLHGSPTSRQSERVLSCEPRYRCMDPDLRCAIQRKSLQS